MNPIKTVDGVGFIHDSPELRIAFLGLLIKFHELRFLAELILEFWIVHVILQLLT